MTITQATKHLLYARYQCICGYDRWHTTSDNAKSGHERHSSMCMEKTHIRIEPSSDIAFKAGVTYHDD